MLNSSIKISHTQTLTELTVALKRKYTIKLPDAIIAATAQFLQVPILTADKVFAQITEVDSIIIEL